MKPNWFVVCTLGVSILLAASGCSHRHHRHHHAVNASSVDEVVAVVNPTAGNACHGVVRFIQAGKSVRVIAEISGLNPNQMHAMHIHEHGDCSAPDGTSAGGHYNPEGHDHGLPTTEHRHAGDLGNLQADGTGRARHEITVNNITLAGMKNPILGRSVIVHAGPDDGGQPTGNAGARIGCGVIGLAKPAK